MESFTPEEFRDAVSWAKKTNATTKETQSAFKRRMSRVQRMTFPMATVSSGKEEPDNIDSLLTLLSNKPFNGQSLEEVLASLKYKGHRINTPRFIANLLGMEPIERLETLNHLTWNGQHFNLSSIERIVDTLFESQDESADTPTLDDDIESIATAMTHNQPTPSLTKGDKVVSSPGLYFWTCRDDVEDVLCQGSRVSSSQVRAIQSTLKRAQRQLEKDLLCVINGDNTLFEKMKRHADHSGDATDKDVSMCRKWLHASGQNSTDRLCIASKPFYSGHRLGKLLSRVVSSPIIVSKLRALLSWDGRRFSREQIKAIMQ